MSCFYCDNGICGSKCSCADHKKATPSVGVGLEIFVLIASVAIGALVYFAASPEYNLPPPRYIGASHGKLVEAQ